MEACLPNSLILWTFARLAYAAPRPSYEESGKINIMTVAESRYSRFSMMTLYRCFGVSLYFVIQVTALHGITTSAITGLQDSQIEIVASRCTGPRNDLLPTHFTPRSGSRPGNPISPKSYVIHPLYSLCPLLSLSVNFLLHPIVRRLPIYPLRPMSCRP
jgi:hypothetical protein